MQRIWITGAGGLLGSWLLRTVPASLRGSDVVGLTRPQLELTDFQAVERAFRKQRPALIFHCAALSRSPECQNNPDLARKVNVEVTAHLAQLAADSALIFLSSDLVFDGRRGNYDESAEVNPLSVYADTKAEAEQIVLRNSAHTVVRTSLNSGCSPTGDRGLDEQLHRAWATGKTLQLFTDEFRCPIGAEITARALWELALQSRHGLFHIAGAERLSRWQIGQVVAARCPELNPRFERASLSEYKGAPRAPDTSLNCAKAQRVLSFQLPRWSQWMASAANILSGSTPI